ncbi:MAG: tripartite tricarboxylate transporter TctB family protein, partial [Planctomycetales bacterium]|nr:tripartite tricarboxylate transporter TctB family protein [Planctomycetales bacterium]
ALNVVEMLVPINILAFATYLFLGTFFLPSTEGVGPAVVPRLWASALVPFCCILIVRSARRILATPPNASTESSLAGRRDDPAKSIQPPRGRLTFFLVALFLYVLTVPLLGYYLATWLFLGATMWCLGERRWLHMISISLAWLLLSYLVFERLLYVPLPAGRIWQ